MKTHISTITIVIFLVLISVVAFAQSPQIAWDYNVSADNSDMITSVIHTSDGGYLMAGYSNSSGTLDKTQDADGKGDSPPEDYWIVKTDQNGTKEWDKTFGGDNVDKCTAGIQKSDGGYLLASYSNSENTEIKTDKDGNLLWDKTIGGNSYDVCEVILESGNGEYLAGGNSWSAGTGDNT